MAIEEVKSIILKAEADVLDEEPVHSENASSNAPVAKSTKGAQKESGEHQQR